MCIVLFAWQQDAQYPLVVAANRDEFHHRPAEAVRWRGDILCGRDLVAGGTWLGVSRGGRFAAVTNFREPVADATPGNRSRGMLPLAFLEGTDTPEAYLKTLAPEQQEYGAFNLLVGDGETLWYMSNRGSDPEPVPPGLHALSNGLLDTPWPKTTRGRALLEQAMADGASSEALLTLLRDDHLPADEELPDTGVGQQLERLVAPIFISSATYGTRASTSVKMGADGFELCEQRWEPSGARQGEAACFTEATE